MDPQSSFPQSAQTPPVQTTPQSQIINNSGNKKLFVIGGVIIFILLLLVGMGFYLYFTEKIKSQIQEVPIQTETIPTATVALLPTAPVIQNPSSAIAGYSAKVTQCYTVYIPSNSKAPSDNSCTFSYTGGDNGLINGSILPEYSRYNSALEIANKWKDFNKEKYISEENINVGKYSAVKLVEDNSGVSGPQYTLRVFIYTPGATLDGNPVSGFSVNHSYTHADQKKAADVLLSTWTWK